MKRVVGFLVAFALFGTSIVARGGLTSSIDAIMAEKVAAKASGVEILRLGDSPAATQIIYQRNANTPRVPASNLKLTTTATALETLGREFTFKTYLAARDKDLALIGDGDPTFGDAELLKKLGWDVDTVFKNWADTLKKRGLDEVHDVVVDDSIFDQDFLHADWPADQVQKRYVAEVGGVNLNANCLDFFIKTTGAGKTVTYQTDPPTAYVTIANTCQTGTKDAVWLSRTPGTNNAILRGEADYSNDKPVSVTVHDPPLFAATVLKETLESCGIKVTGEVKRDRTVRAAMPTTGPAVANGWTAVAVHTTPLAAVLDRANKDSMNLYAESLCKRIGAATTGQPGSWENGTAAVGSFLAALEVKRDEFNLDDGCGLSKKNVVSPNVLARVLEHEYFSPNRDVYQASLAVAGVDGTFEKRFRGSDLVGRVFGKSGFVKDVSTLSGYLKGRDGRWYVFSIMMNEVADVATAKALQERIVQAVDGAGAEAVAVGR